jgi:CheY-specific phosphatase CheX
MWYTRRQDGPASSEHSCTPNDSCTLDLPFNRQQIIKMIEERKRDSKQLIQTVFVDHLLSATSKVLNVISNTTASCVDISHERKFRWPAELTGFMNLAGAAEGAIAVSFPYELAAAIAVGMTGCAESELTESDISDVSDEIVNQIAGNARTELWLPEFNFEIALPLIINNARTVTYENEAGWTMATLLSGDLTFYLQVYIKDVHPTTAPTTTDKKPTSRPLCPVAD